MGVRGVVQVYVSVLDLFPSSLSSRTQTYFDPDEKIKLSRSWSD